jgi:hypothetical protein
MKRLLFVPLLFFAFSLYAQEPVKWSFTIEPTRDLYVVKLTAQLYPGWHIYSQNQPKDAIALPTTVYFNKNPLLSFVGKVEEKGKLEQYKDAVSEIEAYQYSGAISFQQKIARKGNVKTNITGNITYQLCTDEKCLTPKTIPFSIALL